MKKNIKTTVSIIAGIVVIGGIATSLALNFSLIKKINNQQKTIEQLQSTVSEGGLSNSDDYTGQENNVPISDGEYMIRDTSAISNAYKNGDYSSLTDEEKETLEMADEVIKEVTTDDMSDYEKEKAIYEWMCLNIGDDASGLIAVPDEDILDTVDQPYGVLKKHVAVCVGYATTFRLFMNMLDINCMVIHDDYLTHSWNLVNIGDGWYFVDVYMDAGMGDVSYLNFNQTEDMFRESHEWNMTELPEATATEYCYAIMNSQQVKDVNEAVSKVYDSLFDGANTLSFKASDGFTEEDVDIFTYMINTMVSYLDYNNKEFFNYYSMYPNYTELENGNYILTVTIEYWGDYDYEDYESDYNYSEIDYDTADNALADILGITVEEIYNYNETE